MSAALRLLNSRTFGSSHIASSAYQMWPTCGLQYLRTPLKRFDEGRASLPLKSLRISQGMSFPEKLHVLLCNLSSNHSLYMIKLFESSHSNPEGKFGGNQLLDGSMSLSPLYSDPTSNLHVSIATNFHQSFPWLYPPQV